MALPPDYNAVVGGSVSIQFGPLIERLPLGDGGSVYTNKISNSRSMDINAITDLTHETVGLILTVSGKIVNPEPICAEFDLKKPDGSVLHTPGTSCIGIPGDYGYEWWNWIAVGGVWSGPPYDITMPGIYELTINFVSGRVVYGLYKLYFEITGEVPPPPGPHPRTEWLTLNSIPQGASVSTKLDDNLWNYDYLHTPVMINMDPGHWYFILKKEGYNNYNFEYDAVAGRDATKTVTLTWIPPEELRISVSFKNTGNITYTFKVGVSIGTAPNGPWYDVGYYTDGLGDYAEITLAPNQEGTITRTIRYVAGSTDVWATVKKQDLTILDEMFKYNCIQ